MTRYVLGFMFSEPRTYVVFIRKARPEWQRDRLNGIGGKVEPGESGVQAMVREFREETGVVTEASQWEPRMVIEKKDKWKMEVFRCFSDQLWECKTTTDETVQIIEVNLAHGYRNVPNMSWMLPLVIDDGVNAVKIRY